MHDDVVRSILVTFGGEEMETAGDSFLVLFDSAERRSGALSPWSRPLRRLASSFWRGSTAAR
jgi:hypothetical protein